MDSFELNKIAGAVLGTLLFAMGLGFVSELIYAPKPAGEAGYALPGGKAEEHGGGGGEKAEAKEEPIAARLASADADKGKGGTKPCQGCHSFDKGSPNVVGPGLWDIVERKKAGHAGFDYSAALKEKGGTWTYDDLDHFLANPKAYAKGTKMAFAGIASPTDRANVIAYLRTLSDSPKPLPAAEKKEEGGKAADAKPAEGKAAEAKPAEGEKKAEGAKPAAGGGITAKIASASADKGKGETKPCQACHKFDKGGPNGVGPNLWGVVGRKKGSHEGYGYSDAMKAKGGEWTYDDLDAFLTKPGEYVKGTKMAFQGVASAESRANIIAYLRTLADNPAPLDGAKADDGAKTDAGKPADKPAEKAAEKPAETKPADAKPAEAKPADTKPADKPAEAKPAPADKQAADKKPDEAKPADKPAEAKPEGDAKPEAPKPAEDKAPEPKPADEKPAGQKPADEKPAQQ